MPGDILVGVISDTHGLLRPEALDALRGADLILHAGDVGKPEVLDELRRVAPMFVVRGNVDHGDWALQLPVSEIVQAGDLSFYMLHDIGELDLDPPTAGFAAVIFGHSHQPSIDIRDGVLFLNPGSAGPRRFKLPVSVARIRVSGGQLDLEIVTLNV
jgi:putative phosphoesterase